MIEGKQILAARALLGWRREDLVRVSGVSVSALMRMEKGTTDSRRSTINKVAETLMEAGIEFVAREDGSIGVVLTKP